MMNEMFANGNENGSLWIPSVDVKENDKELTFIAELPGMEEKDVQVELSGDLLTLRGERSFDKEEREENYLRIERSYGSFQRVFPINTPVKPDQIAARFKDGILTITVPKAEGVAKQRIPVLKS
ncbi:MAG: Hsp20/alpha crystallin family protein [Fimbriimonas sp.]